MRPQHARCYIAILLAISSPQLLKPNNSEFLRDARAGMSRRENQALAGTTLLSVLAEASLLCRLHGKGKALDKYTLYNAGAVAALLVCRLLASRSGKEIIDESIRTADGDDISKARESAAALAGLQFSQSINGVAQSITFAVLFRLYYILTEYWNLRGPYYATGYPFAKETNPQLPSKAKCLVCSREGNPHNPTWVSPCSADSGHIVHDSCAGRLAACAHCSAQLVAKRRHRAWEIWQLFSHHGETRFPASTFGTLSGVASDFLLGCMTYGCYQGAKKQYVNMKARIVELMKQKDKNQSSDPGSIFSFGTVCLVGYGLFRILF